VKFPFVAAFLLGLSVLPGRAVNIVLDYSFDSNNFFATNPAARTDLEAAAGFYDSLLTDTLTAITPGGSDSWTAKFFNPSTGEDAVLENLTLATNEIRIFVGAGSLSEETLGHGGFGGFSGGGSQEFINSILARGQSGALASPKTDFGPWGGSIEFNLTANWYFDSDPSTTEAFSGQNDFYSVALHELGHVLGIGTSASWFALDSDGAFTGPASTAAYGGAVPLDEHGAHWAPGTMSTIYGTEVPQDASMDPSLATGTRKYLTALDVAGLSDVGWTIAVPEPATTLLLLSAIPLLLAFRRQPIRRLRRWRLFCR
jgi:hypothetical protein